MTIKIPHDFRTHRQAWRNALVLAKVQAEQMIHSDPDEADIATIDANSAYWDNEIKKFDAAFAALAALNLPES